MLILPGYALLLLGEAEQAHARVAAMLAGGYREKEFLELARKQGLLPPHLSSAPARRAAH